MYLSPPVSYSYGEEMGIRFRFRFRLRRYVTCERGGVGESESGIGSRRPEEMMAGDGREISNVRIVYLWVCEHWRKI